MNDRDLKALGFSRNELRTIGDRVAELERDRVCRTLAHAECQAVAELLASRAIRYLEEGNHDYRNIFADLLNASSLLAREWALVSALDL